MNTGGQAFPSPAPIHPNATNGGMTLRDYFAAHAPVTLEDVMEFGFTRDGGRKGRENFMVMWAKLRYEYADAMIAAR
jgi:hypothetical protein